MKRSFTYQEFFALSLEARQRLGLRSLELEKLETKPVIKKAQTWEVRDFSYQFKQAKRSLDLAQLSLSFGEIIAVYGRNGVGKSSFMNSLMGLDQKASLTVSEAGQKLTARSRLKDSFLVMQDVGFQLFSDSVINELALGSKASLVEQEEVLRQLGLWEVKDQHPASLSGGEKQRVAIASALLSSARLICFDEASSGMDYLNMLRIKDLIHSISSVDKIILVASHDHEFLNLLASQIIVLD